MNELAHPARCPMGSIRRCYDAYDGFKPEASKDLSRSSKARKLSRLIYNKKNDYATLALGKSSAKQALVGLKTSTNKSTPLVPFLPSVSLSSAFVQC